jgi:hypothetical protein
VPRNAKALKCISAAVEGIGSRTNPSGAIAPSWGIGILLNLSISRGLMPTLFVGQSSWKECSRRTDHIATTGRLDISPACGQDMVAALVSVPELG